MEATSATLVLKGDSGLGFWILTIFSGSKYQIVGALKVYKHYLRWVIWIPRAIVVRVPDVGARLTE